MIAIVNCGPFDARNDVDNQYEIKANNKVMGRFSHKREDGLAICLEKAAWAVADYENNRTVLCDYCKMSAKLVSGKQIYPHRKDLWKRKYWLCSRCHAYVGTHKNSNGKPLGRLANAELRAARALAHNEFDDRLWKYPDLSRADMYAWLSASLMIPKAKCHIGQFDVDQCHAAIKALRDKLL